MVKALADISVSLERRFGIKPKLIIPEPKTFKSGDVVDSMKRLDIVLGKLIGSLETLEICPELIYSNRSWSYPNDRAGVFIDKVNPDGSIATQNREGAIFEVNRHNEFTSLQSGFGKLTSDDECQGCNPQVSETVGRGNKKGHGDLTVGEIYDAFGEFIDGIWVPATRWDENYTRQLLTDFPLNKSMPAWLTLRVLNSPDCPDVVLVEGEEWDLQYLKECSEADDGNDLTYLLSKGEDGYWGFTT